MSKKEIEELGWYSAGKDKYFYCIAKKFDTYQMKYDFTTSLAKIYNWESTFSFQGFIKDIKDLKDITDYICDLPKKTPEKIIK